MASWNTRIRKLGEYASGAAMALVLSTGSVWAQDVPGDLWSVSYVKVNGADKDAVRRGLQSAADRYFYGDEVEAVLQADVRDGGTFDLSILGPGGKVLGRRQGLSYDQGGDVARSVSNAALGWMGNLGCGDGCAVATSGSAPAAPKKVDVAEAAEAAVERAIAEAPKPAVEVEPVEIQKPAAATKPVVIVQAPKVVKPAVTLPKAPKKTAEARVATKPVEVKKPRKPVAEVARPAIAAAPKADTSTAAKPTISAAVSSPRIPTARAIETPSVAEAPNAGVTPSAPSASSVGAEAPKIAAKPEVAEVPEVKVAQPSAGESEAAAVETTAQASKPEVAIPTPSVAVAPETPSVDTTEAQIAEATPQEVSPGITLPSPSESSAPSTVAEIAEAANPLVSVLAPTTPSVSAIASPTVPEVPAAETTPAIAEVETSAATDDGDGEQLALVNPQQEITPLPTATPEPVEVPAPAAPEITTPAEAAAPTETETGTKVETRIAAVDPTAEGPTLANARWVGFTPAVFTGSDNKSGAWISGPFDRKQRTGWITDTATGATTRVTFIWRDGGSGSRTALLSRTAAKALGLGQGDVANVAVYLPR